MFKKKITHAHSSTPLGCAEFGGHCLLLSYNAAIIASHIR